MKHMGLWIAVLSITFGFLPLFVSGTAVMIRQEMDCYGPSLSEACLTGFPGFLGGLSSWGLLTFATLPIGLFGFLGGLIAQIVMEVRSQKDDAEA